MVCGGQSLPPIRYRGNDKALLQNGRIFAATVRACNFLNNGFSALRLAKRGICRRRVSVCPSVCVCVCVRVCVCLSHSGIVSKRLNVGSRK